MDGARLVARKDGKRRVGSDIVRARVACQDTRVGGGFLAELGIHDRTGNVGGDAGADDNVVGQHGGAGAGGVDIQVADGALAVHRDADVEVQRIDHAVIGDGQGGVHRAFVDGYVFRRAVADGEVGFRGAVDHGFDVAGQGDVHRLLGLGVAVHDDALEAHAAAREVLNKGVGLERGFGDERIVLDAHGNVLACHAVHEHGLRAHVAQHDALAAALAFAAARHDDAAQDVDVIERHAAHADAACQVQVAADGGIDQRTARGVDGDVADHAAQGVRAGGVDQLADRIGEQLDHFGAGDFVLRAEAAVRVAVDEAVFGGGLDIAHAPGGEGAAVGELGDLAGGFGQTQVACHQRDGLFACQRAVRGSGGFGRAAEIAGVIADCDIVGVPG